MANPRKISPFFSRSYGGYSKRQVEYIDRIYNEATPKNILDPMSGQALALSKYCYSGTHVNILDINPACLLFASLRSPELVLQRNELFKWFKQTLAESSISKSINCEEIFCSKWLSKPSEEFILSYIEAFKIDRNISPFLSNEKFWNLSPRKKFAIGMLILIARSIVAHTISSNITWVKQGGALQSIDPKEKLIELAELWLSSNSLLTINEEGSLQVHTGSITQEPKFEQSQFDAIITSPPYANRLDYSVMWAPELQILSFIYDFDTSHLKKGQVGSTVIKGLSDFEEHIDQMPQCAKSFLHSIYRDESYAGKSYYYPFFANYFVTLEKSLKKISSLVANNGHVAIFIRDTVRKNYKFDSESFVRTILTKSGFDYDYTLNDVNPKDCSIIKSHLGLKQNAVRANPIYGKAQVEWSLLLKKGK